MRVRPLLTTLALIVSSSLLSTAQAASTPQPKTPVHKAAPAAAASSEPTAIIHTTAGDLHCTLFPDVAPIGVANFIALASGPRTGPARFLMRKSTVLRFMTAPFSTGSYQAS